MVRTQMDNHYNALRNIRSTVKSRPSVVKRPHSAKFLIENASRGSGCYVRPERTCAQVDSCCPQTFIDLRDKLGRNKAAKLGDFHDREHMRELLSLQARLESVGNKFERKKNP